MKHIIGIDPGFTETGVVLYSDDEEGILRWATFRCPAHGQASAARAASLADHVINEIVGWVEKHEVTRLDVCIEIPFLSKNVDSYQKQMRVVQEIESGLLFRLSGELIELWVTEVSPTQAKLLACNYGQATKDQVIAMSPFFYIKWSGTQSTLEALADAWAIGQGAWAVKGKRFNFSSVKAAKVVRRSDKD